jgi:hypothetical protein
MYPTLHMSLPTVVEKTCIEDRYNHLNTAKIRAKGQTTVQLRLSSMNFTLLCGSSEMVLQAQNEAMLSNF